MTENDEPRRTKAGSIASTLQQVVTLFESSGIYVDNPESRSDYREDQTFLRRQRERKEKRGENWLKLWFTIGGGVILLMFTSGLPLLAGWLKILVKELAQ